jgi:hypothetical protein
VIVKIGARGSDPGGLIRYLGSTRADGKNLHVNPRVVQGSLGYSGALTPELMARVSADLRTPMAMHPHLVMQGGSIYHVSLSVSAKEGSLSDRQWADVAKDFMSGMEFDAAGKAPARWVAVNHGRNAAGADHIHIAASLVRDDGTKVNIWKDMVRASKVVSQIEVSHGLQVETGRGGAASAPGFSKNDSGKSRQDGREPRRIELERRVRAAANAAPDEASFVKNLEADGLKFKAFRKNGQTVGYSVNLPKTITKGGVEHWWAGGKLARDLSLPRLRQTWAGPSVGEVHAAKAVGELQQITTRAATASPVQLADYAHQLAGAAACIPGQEAMSRQVGRVAQTRSYRWTPKPPALSIGLLFLQATDPSGPVGKAVMVKQLMAAMQAVIDANRAQGAARVRGRTPSMPAETGEEEVSEAVITIGVTAAARLVEQRARRAEAEALGHGIHEPAYVAETASEVVQEATQPDLDNPQKWKSGGEPMTPRQAYVLKQRGFSDEDLTDLSKAEASLVLGDRVQNPQEARDQMRAAAVSLAPEGGVAVQTKQQSKPVLTPQAGQTKNPPKPTQGRKV